MPECNNCGNKTSFERITIISEWDIFDPETEEVSETRHSEHDYSLNTECPNCDHEYTVTGEEYSCTECGSDDISWVN